MAQNQRSMNRQRQSAFPIFRYIDMLMPRKLITGFMNMPRHMRWTIVSAVASLVLLWVFLRVVVGSINYWIDTRGAFLKDALYLPYALNERPLPVYPEEITEEDRFLILPDTIGEQYVLQIPPTEEELRATREAELTDFLALSVPVEGSLAALRESLSQQVAVPAETAVEATTADAAAVEAAADTTVVPTIVPTVDPIKLQLTAIDGVLTPLTTLNEALAEADSIDLVYGSVAQIQNGLNSLAASGVSQPLTIEPFKLRIDELAELEPPTIYYVNECLMAAKESGRITDETFSLPPCGITQHAWFVEQGEYLNNAGNSYNIAVGEFPRAVDAAWAIKQLYYRSRAIGSTGDFALENTIEYNYFFSQIEGVYTLTWTNQNWVYSVSGNSIPDIDAMMQIFPY